MERLIRNKQTPTYSIGSEIYEVYEHQRRCDNGEIIVNFRLKVPQRRWFQLVKKPRWVREWDYGCQKGECWVGDIAQRSSLKQILLLADELSKPITDKDLL